MDAQAPASDAERQRLLKALQRANPTLDADMPLAEGTVIQPPARQRSAPARKPKAQALASSADYAEARPAKTAAPKPAAKPRPEPVPASTAGAGGEDRLLLGAAPETPRPGKPGTSGLPSLAETEERILKLETTLHLLTQELEKMDQAIDLATKAIEAQNRLQMAQGMLTPPPPGPSVNAQAVPGTGSSSSQWLELLLSAAIGAGIAVGAAQYLGRRRRYPGDDEAPLAFSGYRAEVTPSIPPRPSTIPPVTIAPASAPTAAPTATLDRPLGRDEGPDFPVPTLPEEVDILLQPEPEVIEAKYEDEHSVLALAEIMLSFGRLRGAADTLAEHIEQTMPDSIEPWSMLLDPTAVAACARNSKPWPEKCAAASTPRRHPGTNRRPRFPGSSPWKTSRTSFSAHPRCGAARKVSNICTAWSTTPGPASATASRSKWSRKLPCSCAFWSMATT